LKATCCIVPGAHTPAPLPAWVTPICGSISAIAGMLTNAT